MESMRLGPRPKADATAATSVTKLGGAASERGASVPTGQPRTGRPMPASAGRNATTLVPPATPGGNHQGENMPLRMRVHDREPIGAALRRFKKLLERSGLTKELRKRKHYEKPCEERRAPNCES